MKNNKFANLGNKKVLFLMADGSKKLVRVDSASPESALCIENGVYFEIARSEVKNWLIK